MRTKLFLLACIACHTVQSVCAWNRTGDEPIAYIAEQHLTPSAKAAIEKYLDGRSIVYYAAWMDQQHEHIPYKHTVAVDADNEPLPPSKRPELDAMNAIMKSIDRLENRSIHPKDTVALDIKFIVHLIADIHCPAHIVYPKITRFFPVTLNGRPQKYHPIWDAMLDNNHLWTYREYQEQLDRFSEDRMNEMATGTPVGWVRENAEQCRVIYDWAKEGDVLGRPFINKAYPLAEKQMLLASYRLAKLLNDIFSEQ